MVRLSQHCHTADKAVCFFSPHLRNATSDYRNCHLDAGLYCVRDDAMMLEKPELIMRKLKFRLARRVRRGGILHLAAHWFVLKAMSRRCDMRSKLHIFRPVYIMMYSLKKCDDLWAVLIRFLIISVPNSPIHRV